MSVHRDPQDGGPRPDGALPLRLAAAVEKARSRQPTPEMVAQLVERATRLKDEAREKHTPLRVTALRIAACLTVAAAVIVAVVVIANRTRAPVRGPEQPVASADSSRACSAVTRTSLVEVAYGQVEADLEQVESHLASVSEAAALAAVRHDVKETLEEYRRWEKDRALFPTALE